MRAGAEAGRGEGEMEEEREKKTRCFPMSLQNVCIQGQKVPIQSKHSTEK